MKRAHLSSYVVFLGALGLLACDEGAVTISSGMSGMSGSANLSAALINPDPATCPNPRVGSTLTIRATVSMDGQPVPNVAVIFSAAPTGVGTFQNMSVNTDTQGQADSILSSRPNPTTTSLTVTVSASGFGSANLPIQLSVSSSCP
ncbi:MAG: hypothetical protein ACE5HD_09575 [Acidobacteriota bacterium]